MAATPYEIITDRISAKLAVGVVPWRKPWRAAFDAPRNLEGRLYRGINVLMLLCEDQPNPIWMTYNQAHEHGGTVRKGEKGTPVIFWKIDAIKVEDPETGETKLRKRFILRYYTVFNLAQTDGVKVPAKTLAGVTVVGEAIDPIEAADAIVEAMPDRPAIFYGGTRAYYRPSLDEVHVPERDSFEAAEHVYSALFHELGHSTGHKSRLDRPGITDLHSFGDEMYGREELVAEMTSAFLCGESGISPAVIENQTAYIANWLEAVKADPKALVVAAGQAQKAADFILGKLVAVEEPATEEAVAA
jgi:antirestriction protein ArdC